jgi:hypothetical protein
MAKKVDLKAKAKRQKIIAAGGAVLLVGILAIQVPKTMKMLNASAPPPPPPPSSVAVGTDPSVLPNLGGAGGATPVAATSGKLPDSDPQTPAGSGQLVVFGRFASKDPFAQQVDPDKGVATAAPEVESGTPASPGGSEAKPESGAPGVVAPTPSGPVSSAVIAVNGIEETVAVKGEFPKAEPIFRLVSATRTTAKIGIAGGALASGEATVTLRKGKPLTLVNTADGVRYELTLVSTS